MKQNLLKRFSTTVMLLVVCVISWAYDFKVGGISYDVNPDGVSVTLVSGNNCTGSVVIPSTVEYCNTLYSVTSIGDRAFLSDGLTSVIIPNSVTSIEYMAFRDCSRLSSVTIPESVISIGPDAFYNTPWYRNQSDGLLYVGKVAYKYKGTMPEDTHIILKEGTLGIAGKAFEDCSGLSSISIPNSVTIIGNYSFKGCSGLTSVTIPNSVTSIGGYAFSGCRSLTSLTIPNSVTSIGGYAFYNCSSLTSLTIPNSVTSIGGGAFHKTPWYDNQPNNRLIYAGKVAYTYKGTMLEGTHIIIKEGTLGIASQAFEGFTGLTSISIPNSVTRIGSLAFYECKNLISVNIPNSVTNIEKYAFGLCKKLKSITIPNSVTRIEDGVFSVCISLTSVTIPNSVINIGVQAFEGCRSLTSVNIPNSVTSIGYQAFYHCDGLTSVTIPESVTSIGYQAFYHCDGLTSVTIPESVTSIGDEAFSGTAWDNNQPDGLVYAGKVAYKYKGTMPEGTQITLKEGTSEIASQAFEGCSGLTSIIIPNSVTNIRNYAFSGCTCLTSVTIPNSVASIGYYAFNNCSAIKEVWCMAEQLPSTESSVFQTTSIASATLYVPASALEDYKSVEPWSGFGTILAIPLTGDANGNGEVEIGDVTSVLTLMATPEATGYNNKAADANGNGVIEIGDVTTILTIMANNVE